MTDIMIDIETLSTRSDAAVIAVGMVGFTRSDGPLWQSRWLVKPELSPGNRNRDTVEFWRSQGELFEFIAGGSEDPWEVGQTLAKLVADSHGLIWAASPQFDIVILENWLRQLGFRDFTFPYRRLRDVRTVRYLAEILDIPLPERTGTAHDPVDDCLNQVADVVAVLEALRQQKMDLYGYRHGVQ